LYRKEKAVNQQDHDRQRRALQIISDFFAEEMPEDVKAHFEIAESNGCWPCVRPLIDAVIASCVPHGWTPNDTKKVHAALDS
jgi:hypothetical protein